jgi:hypothetical protein
MTDEEGPAIIDRIPDFSEAPKGQEQATPKLDPDPHNIGGKARAMHDAHPQSNASSGESGDGETAGGGNRINLKGESLSVHFPETIDQTDLSNPSPKLNIDIAGADLTIKQCYSKYIVDETRENKMDEWQISRSEPAQSFSLKIGDREIVVGFDMPAPVYTGELSANDLEDIIAKVKSLYPHLNGKEDIATATKFEELLVKTAKDKEAEAASRAKDIERKLRERKITLAIGRNRTGTPGIRIFPSIEDTFSGETSSIRLIELVRDEPGKPARAVDISKDGVVIDMTDNPARSAISREHATIEFDGRNEVIITDGSKSGQPSTNGTTVTLT